MSGGWFGGGDEVTNLTENTQVAPNAASATGGNNSPSSSVNNFGEGDVTIVTTDHDAVAGANAVASGAVSEVGDAYEKANRDAYGLVRDVADAAAGAIGSAVSDIKKIAGDALITVEEAQEEALGFGRDALKSNELVTLEAFESNELVVDSAFDFGTIALDTNRDLSRDAIDAVSDSNQRLYDVSQSVVDLTEDVNFQNTEFLGSTLEKFTDSLADLDESRSVESSNVLSAVKQLGETVATGGENIQANFNKLVSIGALLVVGLTVYRLTA